MRKTLLLTNIFIIVVVYLYICNHTVFAESQVFIDPELESNLRETFCEALKTLSKQKDFVDFCNNGMVYPFNKLLFYQQYFSDELYIRKFVYNLPLIEIFKSHHTKGAECIQDYIRTLFFEDIIKTRAQFESKLYFISHVFFSFDLQTIKSNLELASYIAKSYIEIHPDATENVFIITKNEYAQYMKLKPLDTGIIYIAVSLNGDSHEILAHIELVYKYFDLLIPIKMKLPQINFSRFPLF